MNSIPAPVGDLVESWTGQPDLFAGLECSLEVVRATERVITHGATTSRHEQDAARIVAAACLGWSERRIARELGHGRATVAGVLRIAERAGKVKPVKDRVLAAAAAAIHADIELGDRLADDVRAGDGDVAALASLRKSTWVGAGILADKAGGDRGPAVVVNVSGGSVQVIEDYVAQLKAIDSKSIVSGVDLQVVAPVSGGGGAGGGVGSALDRVAGAPAGGDVVESVQGEGGGVGFGHGTGNTDGKP